MKKLLVILIVVMVVLIGITGLVQGESFPVHVEVDDVSYDITYGGHETINPDAIPHYPWYALG